MYGHERKIVKSRYHDESLLEFLNMKISWNNEETRRQRKAGSTTAVHNRNINSDKAQLNMSTSYIQEKIIG